MDIGAVLEEIYTDDAKLYVLSKTIGSSICQNEIKLVDVIEALGPKLTNKDVMDRCQGMNILSAVFDSIKGDYLSEKELIFIVEFLHDRLKDQHLVIPRVIHSINSIITSNNLPAGAAGKLLLQLFKEANIQSHIHKDRQAFFRILEYILDEKIEEIKSLGSDMIMHFIQSMDGEKDPRNLLIIFRCVPIIMNNFPLDPFLEDFFEVLSCYFPIDFNPVTMGPDSDVVTRDNIAHALHLCLSHTSSFAPFLIPLALEKLSSSVVASKLDALRLLEMCCEKSYLPQDLQPSLPSIWAGLRNEIFMGGNEEVLNESMKLIGAAFAMLSKSSDILDQSIKLIFTECKHHLMEPEMRLMQPSSAILLAIAESTELACQFVSELVFSLLYEQFLTKTTASERKSILGFMTSLISTTRKFPKLKLATTVPEWDEILATWFTLLSHSDKDFVNLALGFFTLISSDLDEKSVEILQCHFINLLSVEKSLLADDTRRFLFNCLETLASNFPTKVTENVISGLLKAVENVSENSVALDKVKLILSAIAECSYFVTVAEKVIPFLLEQINNEETKLVSFTESPNFNGSGSNTSLKYLLVFLNCLARIIEKGCSSTQVLNSIKDKSAQEILNFSQFVCVRMNVVQVISEIGISARNRRKKFVGEDDNQEIYIVANSIICNVIRGASENNQNIFVNSFWNQRVQGDDDGLVRQTLCKLPGLLLESLLGPLRRTVILSKRNLLMEELITIAIHPVEIEDGGVDSFTEKDTQAHIRLFANLLNKIESVDDLNRFQERILNLVDAENGSDNNESTIKLNGDGDGNGFNQVKILVDLFMWVLKSLAMRGVDTLDTWIDKMISLLGSPVMGNLLAEEFDVLMSDCTSSLNVESFCNFRFLYKQRLFLSSVPKFVDAYKKSDQHDPCRVNYIRGLSSQLRHVPKTVLHMELNNVLPLLVASLTCVDSSAPVRLSSLNALYDLLNDKSNEETPKDLKDSPLAEYYHDVVPHLVKMSSFPLMDIRIVALKCLQKCAKFPIHMILIEKPLVVEELKLVLNDPKRLVRKEAVFTRNIWILTGAPGGL